MSCSLFRHHCNRFPIQVNNAKDAPMCDPWEWGRIENPATIDALHLYLMTLYILPFECQAFKTILSINAYCCDTVHCLQNLSTKHLLVGGWRGSTSCISARGALASSGVARTVPSYKFMHTSMRSDRGTELSTCVCRVKWEIRTRLHCSELCQPTSSSSKKSISVDWSARECTGGCACTADPRRALKRDFLWSMSSNRMLAPKCEQAQEGGVVVKITVMDGNSLTYRYGYIKISTTHKTYNAHPDTLWDIGTNRKVARWLDR